MARCGSVAYENANGRAAGGLVGALAYRLDRTAASSEAALRYLVSQQFDIYVIHVLSQEEVDPDMKGDLRLVDCEDRDEAEVTVSAPLLKRYKQTLAAFTQGAKEFCSKRGVSYLLATNQLPVDQLISSYLAKRGLVR